MQVLLATKRLLSLSILVLWGLDFCDFENDSDDELDLNINFVKFCLFFSLWYLLKRCSLCGPLSGVEQSEIICGGLLSQLSSLATPPPGQKRLEHAYYWESNQWWKTHSELTRRSKMSSVEKCGWTRRRVVLMPDNLQREIVEAQEVEVVFPFSFLK